MLQTATNQYLLPFSGGRQAPQHGYSISALSRKRLAENTTTYAILYGFVAPTLMQVNSALEKHLNDGTDVPAETLVQIIKDAGMEKAALYFDRLARIACQTGIACVLISTNNAYANSAVYIWDLYPRLHQRYISRLLAALRCPRVIASIFGVAPSPNDVHFIEQPVSGVCAFEDALKRNAIVLVADVAVDTVRILLDRSSKKSAVNVAYGVLLRFSTATTASIGAGVGRALKGDAGEYWGELLGISCGGAAAMTVMRAVYLLRASRRRLSAKGGHRTSSRRRASSSKDASVAPAS